MGKSPLPLLINLSNVLVKRFVEHQVSYNFVRESPSP